MIPTSGSEWPTPLKVAVVHREFEARLDLIRAEAGEGINWVCCDPADDAALTRELRDTNVVVTPRLTEAQAAAAPALRLILTTGAGVDQIATGNVTRVAIANTYNHGRSIAEYVVLCMLALSRGLIEADQALRHGVWRSPMYDKSVSLSRTLRGSRLGILGFGEIGRELCRLASAFDVTVAAIKRRPGAAVAVDHGLTWLGGPADMPRLLKESDFVVVALPLDPATVNLLSDEELGEMRSSAFLINVARGPVVNQHALFDALIHRRLAGAALDVWWSYPAGSSEAKPSAEAFEKLENVILTPHISGLTTETLDRRARDIGANIRRFCEGEPLVNLVRPAAAG